MAVRNAIEIRGLTKQYGSLTAIENITFEVRRGELFGLIGPDGAGKTSLFRLLATLLNPDDGVATVDGFDIVGQYKEIRKRVGYMPGRFSLYPDLSVEENLEFFAALFGVGVKDNYDLIAPIYTQIEPFRKRRAGKLSGGMKQKLALCCALIHRPSVLFLDEPTTGVDAVSRSEFWDMLSELKSKGISILVSTPYMACCHTSANGMPPIISFRTASIYQRAGTIHDNACKMPGIFSTGNNIPDNIIIGNISTIPEMSIAVTCVLAIVEINNPNASESTK